MQRIRRAGWQPPGCADAQQQRRDGRPWLGCADHAAGIVRLPVHWLGIWGPVRPPARSTRGCHARHPHATDSSHAFADVPPNGFLVRCRDESSECLVLLIFRPPLFHIRYWFQECGTVASVAKGDDRYPAVVRFEKVNYAGVVRKGCHSDAAQPVPPAPGSPGLLPALPPRPPSCWMPGA